MDVGWTLQNLDVWNGGADVRLALWPMSRWTATVSWAKCRETMAAGAGHSGTRGGLVPWGRRPGNLLYCLLEEV